MNFKTRILALLMALIMVVSCLVACDDTTQDQSSGENTSQQTNETSETVESSEQSQESEESQEEINPAPQMYKDAVEKLKETADFSVSFDFSQNRKTGTVTVPMTKEGKIDILSYGAENMAVSYDVKFGYWDENAKIKEIYTEGKVFQTYNEDKFYAEMSADEYISRIIPAILFDGELYGELTAEEPDADGNTKIEFSSPQKLEAWAAPDYATLKEFEGKTVIDSEGNIISNECKMVFVQGVTEVEMTVSQEFEYYEEDEAPEIAVSTEDTYRLTEYIDAAMYYGMAAAAIENAEVISYSTKNFFCDYAGGYVTQVEEKADYFNDGDYFLFETDSDIKIYTPEIEYITSTKAKVDGNECEVNMTVNGEEYSETQRLSNSERKVMVQNVFATILEPCADENGILFAETRVVDSYLGIVVKADEVYYEYVTGKWSESVYGQTDFLEDLGAEYSLVDSEIMLTIDLDSYLPVAYNCNYEGFYTYKGEDYEISFEKVASMTIGNTDTYYSITQENYEGDDVKPEDEDKATPLFYKVTGKDGQVMYLMGTVHVGDNRTAYLPEEIYEALENADAFALEIDVYELMENLENYPEIIEIYMESWYYTDGTLLYDHIDEELYEKVCEYQAILGIGGYGEYLIEYTDKTKPDYISSFISEQYMSHASNLHSCKGVDARLYNLAKELEKPIYEVEDKEEHIGVSLKYSDELNEYLLASNLYYTRNETMEEIHSMYEAWCDGNLETLISMVNEKDLEGMTEEELKLYEEYDKILRADRDAIMLEKLTEYLESGETVFVAVGLAHLLREDTGLVETLAEAGYTVELVEYK